MNKKAPILTTTSLQTGSTTSSVKSSTTTVPSTTTTGAKSTSFVSNASSASQPTTGTNIKSSTATPLPASTGTAPTGYVTTTLNQVTSTTGTGLMSQTPNAVVSESTVVAAVVSPIVVLLLLVLALLITIGAILMVKRRKPKAKHVTRIEGDGSQRKVPWKPQDLSNTSKAILIPYQGDDVVTNDIYRNSTVQETELTKSVDEKGIILPAPSLMYDGLYHNCGEVFTSNTTQLDQSIYGLLSEVTTEPVDHEAEPFWMPSSDYEEIYQQMSAKKYLEIPRQQIQVLAHLGSGEFGTVNKGKWNHGAEQKDVALKMLKSNASPQDGVKFLQEAAINGQFHHENIVRLYGVVTVGNPVMIVLELLTSGDLRNYLLKQRPCPGEMLPSTWPNQLLMFCQQVASGMAYLSRKGFVHRDLAARNILLSDKRVCKIADFGMSRNLDEDEYYFSQGGQIPVKWTAPEAIHFKKYSTMSDVWSFGAVMYEIWGLGCKPYEAYTNQQVVSMIAGGVRAVPPPGCPRAIYKLIIQCWNPDKNQRPSFDALVKSLGMPSEGVLAWTQSDIQTCAEAMVLGAPLDLDGRLYKDLQKAYIAENVYT